MPTHLTTFVLAALASLATACEKCEPFVTDESVSPDGRHRVVVFDRRCNGGSDFIAHVSVLDADERPGWFGNVLRVKAAPSETGGRRYFVGFATRWLGNDRVLVQYPAGAMVFEQKPRRGDVSIEYRATLIGAPGSGVRAEALPSNPGDWPRDSVPRRTPGRSP